MAYLGRVAKPAPPKVSRTSACPAVGGNYSVGNDRPGLTEDRRFIDTHAYICYSASLDICVGDEPRGQRHGDGQTRFPLTASARPTPHTAYSSLSFANTSSAGRPYVG